MAGETADRQDSSSGVVSDVFEVFLCSWEMMVALVARCRCVRSREGQYQDVRLRSVVRCYEVGNRLWPIVVVYTSDDHQSGGQ